MRISRWLAVSLVALFAVAAPAQPVFFDDFDGEDLLPHWNRPPDSHWEYEVSGGMLHVTDLLYPSDDHFGGNYADMVAGFEAQTDFRADFLMGWEMGDQPHRLMMHVLGPQQEFIASFGYRFEDWVDPNPVISASTGGGDVFRAQAPPPGLYRFTIKRTEADLEFYFNDSPFASFVDPFGRHAAKVYFEFLGPYPGEFGTVHIDRIRVVPTPGVLALLVGLGAGYSWRRRACQKSSGRRHHSVQGDSK